MPELPRILDLRCAHDPPQTLRHILGHPSVRRNLVLRHDVGPCDTWMKQHDRHTLGLQIHSHAPADGIDGGFGGAVGVLATRRVVADRAHARCDDADLRC